MQAHHNGRDRQRQPPAPAQRGVAQVRVAVRLTGPVLIRSGLLKAVQEGGELRPFGSHAYGVEELTAEMGAAMLCADAGISCDDLVADSASYVASWLRTIREDNKMVIRAGSAASKAADYIFGADADAVLGETVAA